MEILKRKKPPLPEKIDEDFPLPLPHGHICVFFFLPFLLLLLLLLFCVFSFWICPLPKKMVWVVVVDEVDRYWRRDDGGVRSWGWFHLRESQSWKIVGERVCKNHLVLWF